MIAELRGLPAPTRVVTFAGDEDPTPVDHDPSPIDLATACGLWLPVGCSTNPPQGTPCPKCFGDPS